MGTASEGSEGGGFGGDFGVGAIVWVRRRNGSWWPGRVLGPEELAESHLMPPRSGTPVKLLGREDASVDWYNLEKSKRVKPFRCGEFDACIERAEASHSLPIKKREKYARREDAILHALEIEKPQLEMNQQNTAISCHQSNKGLGISERESNNNSSEVHVPNKIANQKSKTSSRKITSSLDEYYLGHPTPVHRNRKVKLSIREQGKHEIVNLLEVEDVFPEVSKSKGRFSFSAAGRNSEIPDENHPELLPLAAGGKNFSVLKRKIVPGCMINDTPKRRDRRQPLLKVLQNSAKLPVSYSFQPHRDINVNPMLGVEDHIDITHDTENYPSSDADDPLDYSRHSGICPLFDDVNDSHLQQPGCMSNESTLSAWTEENEFDSSATDSELGIGDEKLKSGIIPPFNRTAESPIESGMSHWHLKGKRNNRTTAKRLHESVGEKNFGGKDRSNVLVRETSSEGMATNYNMINFVSAVLNVSGEEISCEKEPGCDIEEDELFDGLGNKRYDLERHHNDFVDSDDDLPLISQSGWGTLGPSCNIWRSYLEEPEDTVDQFYTYPFSRMMPTLVDVDLKVQTRYQREHVPLISLMSGLNGKAIVGHPIDIEILEDGSTYLLFPINETFMNGDTAPPPIWRTAKRTFMHRLPRSNPDSQNYSRLVRKCHFGIPSKKKSNYHAHRSASGKFQKKPPKTVNLSSSQKTRTLSSFIAEKTLDVGSGFLGGLLKPDGSMPLVTCIPVKVVFSRILESVGRTSSAVVNRAIVANAAKGDPP